MNVYSIPYNGASSFIHTAGYEQQPIPCSPFHSNFSEENAQELLEKLHGDPYAVGVVVCGGEDVSPALYGSPRHTLTFCGDGKKDEAEMLVIRESPVPVFGFCRGHQLCHVALSQGPDQYAWLDQHLAEHLTECGGSHGVRFVGGVNRPSAQKFGFVENTTVRVNSLHHQGVYFRKDMQELFPYMEVLGISDSKTPVVEIAYWHNRQGQMVLGVQYHPEMLIRPFDVRLLHTLFGKP